MDKKTFYIVDSIKGGCGKSTFSLDLALKKSRENAKSSKASCNDNGMSPVCIVDVDMLGTSWEGQFNRFLTTYCSDPDAKRLYLNDVVDDFRKIRNENIFQRLKVCRCKGEDPVWVDLIIANPDQQEKNKYMISSSKGNIPDTQIDLFKLAIRQLIKRLCVDYNHIVFDMPPNFDSYSEVVLDLLINKNSKIDIAGDIEVKLYMMSSINDSHISSTFNWYSDFFLNVSSHSSLVWNLERIKPYIFICDLTRNFEALFQPYVSPSVSDSDVRNSYNVYRRISEQHINAHLEWYRSHHCEVYFVRFSPDAQRLSTLESNYDSVDVITFSELDIYKYTDLAIGKVM